MAERPLVALADWSAPDRSISASGGSAAHTSHLPAAALVVGSHPLALTETCQEMLCGSPIYPLSAESPHGRHYCRLDSGVLPHLSQTCISQTNPLTCASLRSGFVTDSCAHKAEAIREPTILLGGDLVPGGAPQEFTPPASQALSQRLARMFNTITRRGT